MRQKITDDLKQAIQNQDQVKVSVLRLLEAALQNAEIKNNREKLKDEEVLKIIKSEIKKREEASELYKKGDRGELAQKEDQEIVILKKYLPEQLGEDKIKEVINKVIEEQQLASAKDFGKLMGAVMKEVGGQADGGLVNKLVKEALTPKEEEEN